MFLAPFFAPVYFAASYFPELGGIDTRILPGRAAVVVTGSKLAAKSEVTQ